jgi:hypothetical protein
MDKMRKNGMSSGELKTGWQLNSLQYWSAENRVG